jgi:hypothetical protein
LLLSAAFQSKKSDTEAIDTPWATQLECWRARGVALGWRQQPLKQCNRRLTGPEARVWFKILNIGRRQNFNCYTDHRLEDAVIKIQDPLFPMKAGEGPSVCKQSQRLIGETPKDGLRSLQLFVANIVHWAWHVLSHEKPSPYFRQLFFIKAVEICNLFGWLLGFDALGREFDYKGFQFEGHTIEMRRQSG